MKQTESDIVFESGEYFVLRRRANRSDFAAMIEDDPSQAHNIKGFVFVVCKNGYVHAWTDSTYCHQDLAEFRCAYLAKRDLRKS